MNGAGAGRLHSHDPHAEKIGGSGYRSHPHERLETPARIPIMAEWRTLAVLVFVAAATMSPSSWAQPSPAGDATVVPRLTRAQADRLAELPLACLQQEYPNKLGQTLGSDADLADPATLHPAFFGCFDWHSAVHGHWSLVALLRRFPDLDRAADARRMLAENLAAEHIAAEVTYFEGEHSKSYERTYGWAWLLKLASELSAWEDPLADELGANLQPLADLLARRFREFLPLLNYAVRTGEHPNTAFGLVFARDYARTFGDAELEALVDHTARRFYQDDADCPISWEPGGYDFLSPCLEEVDLMRRVLTADEFHSWLLRFLPALAQEDYSLAVGEVSDRSDGKLVHLDGLNFSRAWVLLGLARQYPERYGHLTALAARHLNYSLPNLVGDSYEGGHWLGSFAIYALLDDH
jgi:hypothetical protein